MSRKVSASEAAALVGKHERVVRRRLARGDLPGATKDARGVWQIDVDELAGILGWRVDAERLALLDAADGRSRAGMLAKIDATLATVASIERRLTALEQALRTLRKNDALRSPPDGREGAGGYGDMDTGAAPSYDLLSASGDVLAATAPPAAHAYGLSPDARHILSDLPRLRTKTDAARWLVRHGLNSESTAKGWRDWPEDLTPTSALRFALDIWREAQARRDWRVTWALHRCDDPTCVCQSMLVAE